jgi:DNA-binding NtrC family response regulator
MKKDIITPRYPILIVDDEFSILMAIDTTLRMSGYNNIITCQDSTKVMQIIDENQVGIVLLDLNMPGEDGETLLSSLNRQYNNIPVIVVTGNIDLETAIRCMKSGALDYVIKPVKKDRLITAVGKALEFRELKEENSALKQHLLNNNLQYPEAFEGIITQDKKMLSIFQYLESIAKTSQPVLITGETGVGKELFARAVHVLSDLNGQFVAVNVAGLDDNVFSDTLFGHTKGAFTGAETTRKGLIEEATGGTLFLDEIGDLAINSQVKLLRLLQEKEYMPIGQDIHKKTDARVIVATNQDLWDLQKKGMFREDLIYRLITHQIHIPPLRERGADIQLLTDYFLKKAAKTLNKPNPTPPKEIYSLLKSYFFPGNVRELSAMIFDTVSIHKQGILSLNHLRAYMKKNQKISHEHMDDDVENVIFPKKLPTLKQMSQILVDEAMKRSNNIQSIAAGLLGISHQALNKRLKQMKLGSE